MKPLQKSIPKDLTDSLSQLSYYQFGNGLRLVYKQSEGTATTQIGYVINAGSRDDDKNPGIAHCFEHMLFRGTEKRNSKQIINRIEEIGGELNAFTAKDITVVYANVLSIYFKRTLELLTDIVFKSKFTEQALLLEKNIIREEINLYLDTPEEFIYDELISHLYPNQAMGYNILGDEATLNNISIQDLNAFYKLYYQPKNMVLSIVSNLPFQQIIKACQFLEGIENNNLIIPPRKPPVPSTKFNITQNREFNLAYNCIGQAIADVSKEEKYHLMLLNNIIGGPGMNSLLNLSIREKYGLTYQIESNFTYYDNTSIWYIFYATEEKHRKKTRSLVAKTLKNLISKNIKESTLFRAKLQFANQLKMAEESKSSLMIYNGKQLLLHNQIESLDEYLDNIKAISTVQLQETLNKRLSIESLSTLEILPEK